MKRTSLAGWSYEEHWKLSRKGRVCVFDRMREVDLGSGRALLIKQHGEFSAMGHKCPHYGAPLVKGEQHILL